MITAVIIDDEKKSKDVLKHLILETGLDVEIIGEADSVETGYAVIQDKNPQLIFLDVEMLDGTGFNLLEKFKTIFFEVIFITAYDKYAIKAFKFSAIDYLLKPIDIDELEKALGRVKKNDESILNKDLLIESLLRNIKQETKRITIKSALKIEFVEVDTIICINSDSAYAEIIMDNGRKIVVSKPLKHFNDLLDDNLNFFRLSKSTLINMVYLQTYNKKQEKVLLNNGMSFEVARRRKREFLKALENF